jgi:hypothetical protein
LFDDVELQALMFFALCLVVHAGDFLRRKPPYEPGACAGASQPHSCNVTAIEGLDAGTALIIRSLYAMT